MFSEIRNKEMWNAKRHYVLIQKPVRYEICDDKSGEWDFGIAKTPLLDFALLLLFMILSSK